MTATVIEQAKSVARNENIRSTSFWRIYSSDIERTQSTSAHILLADLCPTNEKTESKNGNVPVERCLENSIIRTSDSASLEAAGVKLDQRWRELAKGAREGCHKSLSMAEAIEKRVKSGTFDKTPMNETDNDAWHRVTSWLKEVVLDACVEDIDASKEKRSEIISKKVVEDIIDSSVYNILVVGHSAIFRVFLTRLLGQNTLRSHSDATYKNDGKKLEIPNASLTIIDKSILLHTNNIEIIEENLSSGFNKVSDDGVQFSLENLIFSSSIVQLNSTSHFTDAVY